MLYNLYHYIHNNLGLHFWDVPAILVGVILIIMLIVHVFNQKRRDKKYEKAREEKLEEIRTADLNNPASEQQQEKGE